MCTQAGRLDEALDLVKRLARQHGAMQQATLNSLTRALSASHVDRALRLLSLMNTLGLRATRCCPEQPHDAAPWGMLALRINQCMSMFSCVGHQIAKGGRMESIRSSMRTCGVDAPPLCRETCVTLIRACAKASRSDVAEAMYWDLRRQKLEVTRSAGSALIVSLCAADATAAAQTVYNDMMMVATGDKSSPVCVTVQLTQFAPIALAAMFIWYASVTLTCRLFVNTRNLLVVSTWHDILCNVRRFAARQCRRETLSGRRWSAR